jgi:ribosome-associated toxin RatA of RatAB toxin-antitoxin module
VSSKNNSSRRDSFHEFTLERGFFGQALDFPALRPQMDAGMASAMKASMLSKPWWSFRSGMRWLQGATLGIALASAAAASDGSQPRKTERYDVKTQGLSAGAARTVVLAPDGVVRSVVTDFSKYDSFISRFKQAKVVGKVGDKTDVYLQVPIMNGAVKIWAIVRFDPPKQSGNDQVISGKMVKGNVKRLDAVWRIHKVNDESTELRLELLIVPDLPVPESLVLPEVRYAADKAVSGTRDEAERRASVH